MLGRHSILGEFLKEIGVMAGRKSDSGNGCASRQPRGGGRGVAHGESRGEKCVISQSPVRGDRIVAKENFLSPLRGSD